MSESSPAADRAARLQRAIEAKRAGRAPSRVDLPSRPAHEPARLGDMPRGLWFLHQVDPQSPAYNLCSAFRVAGTLDLDRLAQAFTTIVARHCLLRSTFRADVDGPVLVVHEPAPLVIERMVAEAGTGAQAAAREASRPFDLERGPLLRLRWVEEVGARDPILLLVVHHIVADERALACIWQEVADAYAGCLVDDAAVAQYDDYVYWLRQQDPSRRDADLAYWQGRLDPAPDVLRLPFERDTPEGHRRGALIERSLDIGTQRGVSQLAASVRATPFMIYALGFRLLLHRYTGGQRVAFATPVSTRAHRAAAHMVGYFLNPIVVCADIDERDTVARAAARFGDDLRDLIAHAAAPFDEIAARVGAPREPDRHPIFQAMFVYQEATPPPALGEARLSPVVLDPGASKFDFTLFVTEDTRGLRVGIEYRADRFDAVWIERALDHYATLLAHLPADPEQLVADVPLVGPAEAARIAVWEQGPSLDVSDAALVPRQILDRARSHPDAPAVVCGTRRATYGHLAAAARDIAGALGSHGINPDHRVAVFLDRSVEMVAAVVGSHLAGAAYVPLDPAYPAHRTRLVLEDADVAAVVTNASLAPRLPPGPWHIVEVDEPRRGRADDSALREPTPESVAYVLFTSGSTGRPKGVVVTHDNLRVSTMARLAAYDFNPRRFLLLPSLAFDSSVAGLFWTLATGGTLVVPTDDEARDPARLARLIADERVTSLLCVPSLYAHLLDIGGNDLSGLAAVIVAGERCPSRLVAAHRRTLPEVRLFNEYGPTEATVWATLHEMTPEDETRPVPIGRPIPGVRVEVLDGLGRRVPAGVPGHGWIAGRTVARGYWRHDDLTAERFVEASGGGDVSTRRYRTGDRLTWTTDGRLLFLGRDDDQIKLRGFRIEPGDVETALVALDGIGEAVVVARARGGVSHDDGDATELVAFVTRTDARPLDAWRQQLSSQLPAHLVPTRLVELPELPRLPNGKIDRTRLRAMPLADKPRPRSTELVVDAREQALLALWEGLLGRLGLGVDDNFFELGGHSLLVVQMVAAIERDLGVVLPAAEVFEHPTVRSLVRRLDARGSTRTRQLEHLVVIQPSGQKTPFIMAAPHFFTAALATRFRGERPVYGLRGVGLRAEGNRGRWPTMTALAEEIVDEIQERFPGGRAILAGYSFGAWVAIETTRVMEARGLPVSRLYVIAPMPVDFVRLGPIRLRLDDLRRPLTDLSPIERLLALMRQNHPFTRGPYRRARQWLFERPWRRALSVLGTARRRLGLPLTPRILQADVRAVRYALHAGYEPRAVRTPTVFFNPIGTSSDAAATWRPYFSGPLVVHATPDPHDDASVDAARAIVLRHLDDVGD